MDKTFSGFGTGDKLRRRYRDNKEMFARASTGKKIVIILAIIISITIIGYVIYMVFSKENFSPRLGFYNSKNGYTPSKFVGDDRTTLDNYNTDARMIGRRETKAKA